jgi:hypothetical protein
MSSQVKKLAQKAFSPAMTRFSLNSKWFKQILKWLTSIFAMKLPNFSESGHPLIQPLLNQDDRQLLAELQQKPEQGRYFIAIFCRYGPLTYSLLRNRAVSQLQVDYLFARVWRNLFYRLRGLNWEELQSEGQGEASLQSWIFQNVALSIHQDQIPPIESIQYSLDDVPLPLWCYLQTALDHVESLPRLILVLTERFHWPPAKVVSFLKAEGHSLATADLATYSGLGQAQLEAALPADIREIYLALTL